MLIIHTHTMVGLAGERKAALLGEGKWLVLFLSRSGHKAFTARKGIGKTRYKAKKYQRNLLIIEDNSRYFALTHKQFFSCPFRFPEFLIRYIIKAKNVDRYPGLFELRSAERPYSARKQGILFRYSISVRKSLRLSQSKLPVSAHPV